MNANLPLKSESTCTEAPASWSIRYITPDSFECQLTLRSESGLDALQKAEGVIGHLLRSGCLPCGNGKSPNNNHNDFSNGNSYGNDQDRSWCPVHQCSMRKWEKDGRVWYSHKAGDQWCNGKAKGK